MITNKMEFEYKNKGHEKKKTLLTLRYCHAAEITCNIILRMDFKKIIGKSKQTK